MKSIFRFSSLACAGFLLFGPFPAASAAEASPADSKPKAQTPVPPSTITVDFPGGTLAQLVAAIAKTPGGPLNILGDQKDLATPLPPFSVQNVHPQAFAQALNQLLETRGLGVVPTGSITGTKDIFAVRRNPGRSDLRESFESIQLAPYLEHQNIDDIVGAIRAAWELDPMHDAGALRLKFHPATTILLVSGPQEAIQITIKTIAVLIRTPDANPKNDPKPSYTPAPAPAKR